MKEVVSMYLFSLVDQGVCGCSCLLYTVYSLHILEFFFIMSVCLCVVSTSLVRVLLLVRKKVNWGIFFFFSFFLHCFFNSIIPERIPLYIFLLPLHVIDWWLHGRKINLIGNLIRWSACDWLVIAWKKNEFDSFMNFITYNSSLLIN